MLLNDVVCCSRPPNCVEQPLFLNMELEALQRKGISLFRLISPPLVPDFSEHGMPATCHVKAMCSASDAVACAHSAQPLRSAAALDPSHGGGACSGVGSRITQQRSLALSAHDGRQVTANHCERGDTNGRARTPQILQSSNTKPQGHGGGTRPVAWHWPFGRQSNGHVVLGAVGDTVHHCMAHGAVLRDGGVAVHMGLQGPAWAAMEDVEDHGHRGGGRVAGHGSTRPCITGGFRCALCRWDGPLGVVIGLFLCKRLPVYL